MIYEHDASVESIAVTNMYMFDDIIDEICLILSRWILKHFSGPYHSFEQFGLLLVNVKCRCYFLHISILSIYFFFVCSGSN